MGAGPGRPRGSMVDMRQPSLDGCIVGSTLCSIAMIVANLPA